MRFEFAALLWCVLAPAILFVRPCAAQTPCRGLPGGTNYKVLIDEVEFATAGGDQPAVALEFLQTSVEGALEKIRHVTLARSASQTSIIYWPCAGRHPQASTPFPDDYMTTMAANHAILELWGTLSLVDTSQHQFDIHYVMFPVSSVTAPPPSGIAATQKKMASKPTPVQLKNYLVDARADLPAYFTLAAGVQAYADHDWAQAVPLLCESRTRLKKPDQQDLMKFADQLATKAGAELRKSTDPAGASMLSEAQAQNYCAFGTTR